MGSSPRPKRVDLDEDSEYHHENQGVDLSQSALQSLSTSECASSKLPQSGDTCSINSEADRQKQENNNKCVNAESVVKSKAKKSESPATSKTPKCLFSTELTSDDFKKIFEAENICSDDENNACECPVCKSRGLSADELFDDDHDDDDEDPMMTHNPFLIEPDPDFGFDVSYYPPFSGH